MELHHPDFAELTALQLVPVEPTPLAEPTFPPSLLPLPDENLLLALHAWN